MTVSNLPKTSGYSDLQVLKSAAGWYVGTTYTHGSDSEFAGLVEPGSRESGYFSTEELADQHLQWLQHLDQAVQARA